MKVDDDVKKGLEGSPVQNPCDLDLLLFFARHPRTLMASEHLARLLGYQLREIAQSLEVLLAARFLTRTQHSTRSARLYVFAPGGMNGGWLPTLVERGSTREGRLELRRALTGAATRAAVGSRTSDGDDAMTHERAGPQSSEAHRRRER